MQVVAAPTTKPVQLPINNAPVTLSFSGHAAAGPHLGIVDASLQATSSGARTPACRVDNHVDATMVAITTNPQSFFDPSQQFPRSTGSPARLSCYVQFERTNSMQPSLATSIPSARAATNRANAQYSTGPRTESGKLRSSRNAIRHGLTSQAAVLPSEDPAAYQLHCRQFHDEYQPQTPTEIHLVQELADTAWRLNRIPLLEADLLAAAARLRARRDPLALSIDTTRALATLGLHGQRLSRQFHKTLDQLRAIQAEHRQREAQDFQRSTVPADLHKPKETNPGLASNGFVFSESRAEPGGPRPMTPPPLTAAASSESLHAGS